MIFATGRIIYTLLPTLFMEGSQLQMFEYHYHYWEWSLIQSRKLEGQFHEELPHHFPARSTPHKTTSRAPGCGPASSRLPMANIVEPILPVIAAFDSSLAKRPRYNDDGKAGACCHCYLVDGKILATTPPLIEKGILSDDSRISS
jgi:hypothetical protein